MKRIVGFAVILIASIALSSCYIMSAGNTGSISISVPTVTPKTVTSAGGTSVGDQIRVYLYTYAMNDDVHYSLYTFPGSDTPYKQVSNPSGASQSSITIPVENLPSGYWQVLVATGTELKDHFLSVKYYGHSKAFHLAPGVETPIALTLNHTPFSINPDLLGSDVVGVREFNGSIYAATPSAVYDGPAAGQSALETTGSMVTNSTLTAVAANGNSIESLSDGYVNSTTKALFLNTANKAIVPYAGSTVYSDFSKNLLSEPGLSLPLKKLVSGAFPSANPVGAAVFFQSSGGLGGTPILDTDSLPPTAWLYLDTSEIVAGQPLYGFTTHNGFAYVASKMGAFRLNYESFNGAVSDILNPSSGTGTAEISLGKDVVIKSIAIDDTNSTIYLGTTNGVYKADLTETSSTPIQNAKLLEWTKGDSFNKIAINSAGDIAMRSRYNLYIEDGTGTHAYSFISGLPVSSDSEGALTSMSWGTGSNAKTLYIAGNEGLVAIDAN